MPPLAHEDCRCNPEMALSVQSRNDTLGLNPVGEGTPAELVGVAPPGCPTVS
jgi:hypothetical protein